MTITLYQFPISHYCEKVRWALDYKGVPYRTRNLLPGQHFSFVKKVAPRSHVPLLEADGQYIQGSAAIIDWLDENFPERPLTPDDPELAEQARAWERFADQELGPHVRRWCYFTLLDHPRVVLPALTAGTPRLMRPLFRLMFPKVQGLMRKAMHIYPDESRLSAAVLDEGLERLARQLSGRDFVVGDKFTRADLAAAALLAPFFMPPQYGVDWPNTVPDPLSGWVQERRDRLAWAEKTYRDWR